MTKEQLIDYFYDNHVTGDLKIEEMAEDICETLVHFKPCPSCRSNSVKKSTLELANKIHKEIDQMCKINDLQVVSKLLHDVKVDVEELWDIRWNELTEGL